MMTANTPVRDVMVTGASRGIGQAIAAVMLQQDWRVIGTSRQGKFPAPIAEHPAFTGIAVDFGHVPDLFEHIKPRLMASPPTVLVNNVGTFEAADMAIEDEQWLQIWQHTLQVNLTASALLSKWFINAHVARQSSGVIINIASRAAYRGDEQPFAAYAASKGGMVALTKTIARDFGRQGIVAYSIAPGFVNTDMAGDAIACHGEAHLTRESSFDRLPQPEEVATMVAFLANGQLPNMTGGTFHINGGSYLL